jgi:hypothetical protein
MKIRAMSVAAETCKQLPSSLQSISVSYIGKASELQHVDEQLSQYLQPCLASLDASNTKAICSNGKLAAEQALRVIARVDAAGKHNAFLSNAKMKSYKEGISLLDRIKSLVADRTCQ